MSVTIVFGKLCGSCFDSMVRNMNQMFGNYQLREAAGSYWLIDMAQSGEQFKMPLQLNETGAKVLAGLYEGLDEEALAKRLASEYGIAAKELREDVAAFASQLAANGIRFGRKNGES